MQDNCDSVDEMAVGNEVEITYRLNGRKWQRDSNSEVKFFLNLEAVDFQIVGAGGGADGGAKAPASIHSANDAFSEAAEEDDDDIPF